MFQDFLNNIIPYVSHFGQGVYLFVFFVALLEALIFTAFFIPGTTLILLISFFAFQNGLDIRIVFIAGFFGVLSGNIISYFIGLNYHNKNVEKIFKIIKLESIQKSKSIIENNSFKTLTIGRLIPIFKEVIFFLAGVNHMRFFKFLIFTIIGNFVWAFVFIVIPYIFSYSLTLAELWIDKFSYFVLILFFILLFLTYLNYLVSEYGKDIFKYIFSLFINIIKMILRIRFINNLIKKNPKKVVFLKNRFIKDEFFGLPFTILSLLIIYFLLIFIGLVEDILTSDIIVGLDIRLSAFFHAFRNDLLVNIFLWITSLGREYIIIGFFIIFISYLYIYNKINEILAFSISFFGSIITGYLLKIYFHHTRPELPVYIEQGFSFPSLHAIVTMTFYGYIFWLIIKNSNRYKVKINYLFTFFVLAFLIGFSRLYLGVHYLSDVLGGFLIGVIWLLFSIGLTEFLNIKYHRLSKSRIRFSEITMNYIFLIIIFFYFILYTLTHTYNIIDSNLPNISIKNNVNISDIFSNNSLKYSQTFMGNNAENINFIFLAKNDDDLKNIFLKSKWEDADKLNYKSIISILSNLLFMKTYDRAPITPLFWDNKTQDFSFQKGIQGKNIKYRHHIRIWKTDNIYDGYFVYVGVGVFDDGLKWWYFTHKISPDINKEREYIYNDLEKTNLLEFHDKLKITSEYNGKNIFGDNFFSDGYAYLLYLNGQ